MDDLGSILEHVTEFLWTTTLGLALERVPGDPVPSWAEPPMVAAIELWGDWNGRVTLSCPRSLAGRVARLLLGTEGPQFEPGDLEDALGELVNMTGGNVKACLGSRCGLSLPVTGPRAAPPAKDPVCRRSFLCEGEPLVLSIFGGPVSRETP